MNISVQIYCNRCFKNNDHHFRLNICGEGKEIRKWLNFHLIKSIHKYCIERGRMMAALVYNFFFLGGGELFGYFTLQDLTFLKLGCNCTWVDYEEWWAIPAWIWIAGIVSFILDGRIQSWHTKKKSSIPPQFCQRILKGVAEFTNVHFVHFYYLFKSF